MLLPALLLDSFAQSGLDKPRSHQCHRRRVVQVRIAEDYETGKRKGFGHVEFAAPESAVKAMEFNGEELEGRALRIDVSAPRQRAPP